MKNLLFHLKKLKKIKKLKKFAKNCKKLQKMEKFEKTVNFLLKSPKIPIFTIFLKIWIYLKKLVVYVGGIISILENMAYCTIFQSPPTRPQVENGRPDSLNQAMEKRVDEEAPFLTPK